MLVELVERLGHSFEWWLEQPLAFLRYCYLHLQEIDRRRRWDMQMSDLERAWFNARAFHHPDSLRDEHQRVIASAAGSAAVHVTHDRGLALAAALESGRVFDGTSETMANGKD